MHGGIANVLAGMRMVMLLLVLTWSLTLDASKNLNEYKLIQIIVLA